MFKVQRRKFSLERVCSLTRVNWLLTWGRGKRDLDETSTTPRTIILTPKIGASVSASYPRLLCHAGDTRDRASTRPSEYFNVFTIVVL